ncbi:MAG: prephenate dehydratase [Phycisphaerales bacterium]|nr:prephenate dehydratase [Phycisphaerales bacterium]
MTSDPPENPEELDLGALRNQIDEIDDRLVKALADRARVVVEVGRAKRGDGTPIYAPDREKRVLERVLEKHDGPLSNRTIEAIYRELMSGSFSLELPLRIGYLGPPGSFSHGAAVSYFGSSVELVELALIEQVFEEVATRRAQYGLVPYENSIGGSVIDTLDAFRDSDVTVYAEALVEVNQSLLANCPPSEIVRIYSKPDAFNQCRRWLAQRFPNAELVPRASTSRAVIDASKEQGSAAVGSPFAGELYGMNVFCERISDNPNNITRFLVLSREAARVTGEDKTSLMFTTTDKPGALVDVLNEFRSAGVNLSHIEKRPSGRENWEYTFFVDAIGHFDEPAMQKAIEGARVHCVSLKILGSYPRASRIL